MNSQKVKFLQRERWHLKRIVPHTLKQLSNRLGIDPILARILIVRDLQHKHGDQLQHFIFPSNQLVDSYTHITLKKHLDKALERIARAINHQERILINGDPDADGISGAAVFVAGLRHLGAYVKYDFPVRAREGHGIQPRIIDDAVSKSTRLIISADCGSKDVEAIDYANFRGIDVIVTDHHIIGHQLPNALAVVNPQLVKGTYPEKKLSGSGVAYKLIVAIFDHLNVKMPPELKDFLLALVVLGTLSDRMTLLEPMNRIMVKKGVDALNNTNMEGLKALRRISAKGYGRLLPRDISRTLVPRLNAPGRIGDRELGVPDSVFAVDLLLLGKGTENAHTAKSYIDNYQKVLNFEATIAETGGGDQATVVDEVNEKRKAITSKIEDEIDILVEKEVDPEKDRIVIVRGKDWNPGVIGIDTDRLKERFLRPAVILTEFSTSDFLRGSCRSIPSINMYAMMESIQEQFEKKNSRPLFRTRVSTSQGEREIHSFGGHSQACGFSIHKEDYKEFVSMVRKESEGLEDNQFKFTYEICDIISFSDINETFYNKLNKLSPYGQEFDFPVFLLKGCTFGPTAKPFGNKYQKSRTPHVELSVIGKVKQGKNEHTKVVKAVGFGLWEKYQNLVVNSLSASYDIIFYIEKDTMRGKRRKPNVPSFRLNIQDIRRSKK